MSCDYPTVGPHDHLNRNAVVRSEGGELAAPRRLDAVRSHRRLHHALDDRVVRPSCRELGLARFAGAGTVAAAGLVAIEDVDAALWLQVLDVEGVAAGESQA